MTTNELAPISRLTPLFPDEIFKIILNKLPSKSLLRFKSVSKPLCEYISSDNFKITYNTLSWKNVGFLVVDEHVGSMFSLLCDSSTDIVKDIDVFLYKVSAFTFPEVTAVANGLVVLSTLPDYECVIWNPSTNRYKIVTDDGFPGMVFGLGYSSSRDDYFVIGGNSVDTGYRSYSVKRNVWESINYPSLFGPLTAVGLYETDVLYWDVSDIPGSLIELDLNTQVFYKISAGTGSGGYQGGLPIIAVRNSLSGYLVLRSDQRTSEIWRADHGLRLTDAQTVWTCLKRFPAATYGALFGFLNDHALVTMLNRNLNILRLTKDDGAGVVVDGVAVDLSGSVKAYKYQERFLDFPDSRADFITAKVPPEQRLLALLR